MSDTQVIVIGGAVILAALLIAQSRQQGQGQGQGQGGVPGYGLDPAGGGMLTDDTLYQWGTGGGLFEPGTFGGDDVLRIDITKSARDYR